MSSATSTVEPSSATTEQPPPFRVLSIDGGGIRGLYSAVLLHGLAQRIARTNNRPEGNLDIGSAFQLIVGTSTGALLATALAAGVALEDVIALYRNQASAIFQDPAPKPRWPLYRWLWRHRTRSANSAEPLRTALEGVFKQETVKQMYERRAIALCVPTINVETQKSWVWKTPHDKKDSRLQRDNEYTLVDVCLSSAAAPIVFPVHGVARPNDAAQHVNWFVDGGLWANNPSLVAMIEALSIAPPDTRIEIVSVSTCPPFQALPMDESSCGQGILGWKGGIRALEVAIDAQSFAYDYMTRTLASHLGRVTYVRLSDPPVSPTVAAELRLDNASTNCLKALVSLGHEAIDRNLSEATTGDKSKALLTDIFRNLPVLPKGAADVQLP